MIVWVIYMYEYFVRFEVVICFVYLFKKKNKMLVINILRYGF